uniref:Uncharacterized protein n=1 Tax=Rhizophora mucronata TaxID=61149 RepID=A0A2P2JSV2_RHIMU
MQTSLPQLVSYWNYIYFAMNILISHSQ